MSFRFEIIPFIGYQDGRANSLKKHFNAKSVTVIDVYTVDKDFDNTQKRQILKYFEKPFYPKLVLDGASYPKFEYSLEIGFLAGVTDNVGNTAKQIIQDALMTRFNEEEAVYSSVLYLVSGIKDIQKFAESLYNPLIQYLKIKKYNEFIKDGGMGLYLPKVKLDKNLRVDEVDIINADDKTLEDIGKNGIKNSNGTSRGPLGMRLEYMQAVKDYFIKQERNPTDIELETIAQTWSEHCKHTIFAASIDDIKDGLYKHYIKRATKEIRKAKGADDICVSVFSDNSGAIKLNDDYFITDKMETHNSPSALDPFGGAITGIVGVNRDTIGFGLGAKPFINRYGFCFPYPDKEYNYYRSKGKKNKILSPDFIMKGVINGIKVGGNCSGIPTNSGFVYFDDRFCGKPLVFAGTLGIIPAKIGERNSYEKCAKPKDKVVMIGGRVGKDGIHGATFSSESLNENSPKTAVQIGDPITQKKLSDFLIKEARDKGLYNSITDNGAGGLSSSVGEMAEQSGGVIVDLDRVPLKYQGLQAWEIWISESQERMTLAVPSDKLEEFLSLAYKREIEACVIGEFTDSGKIIIKYNNKTILDMDMDFLHEGLPKTHLLTKHKTAKEEIEPKISKEDFINNLLKMLSRPNICSKEFLSHLYDHEVQGGSVLKPIQGKGKVCSEATITRPLLDKTQGIVVSSNVNPRYSDIDTYKMAACTIDNAIKSCISAGANPNKIALMDNFCWCSSDEPERLFELKRAAQACYDYACIFETPFISGKDSMFNDFKGFDENDNELKISIPPTLAISAVGIIDDIFKAVSMDVKFAGDLIYVVGDTQNELGASEFYNMLGILGHNVPKVDGDLAMKKYFSLYKAISKNLIASSIPVSLGGLGVALAKTLIAGELGASIDLSRIMSDDLNINQLMFSETMSRFIVTINPKNKSAFEDIMQGTDTILLGEVQNSKYLKINGRKVLIKDLEKAYKTPFEELL